MSSENGKVPAKAANIKLDESDLRAGLALSRAAQAARERAHTMEEAEQIFANNLYDKYGVSPLTHIITNWFDGFRALSAEERHALAHHQEAHHHHG